MSFPKKRPKKGAFWLMKFAPADLPSSSATESRLRDEGGKESEALFDFASLGWSMNFAHLHPSLRSGG